MAIFSTSKSNQGSSSLQSATIATLGGAQISLTLLEKMTDGVPVPFVKATAGTAVEIIRITRVIQSNREECEELLKRSASLLVVILGSFSGKAETAIPEDIKPRVERLANTFHEVRTTLEKIEKRNGKRRAMLYHYDNAEKLKGCSFKLDWAMQEFQVESQVDSCLKDLERHEELRKELQDGRNEMRKGQEEMQKGLSEVRDAVKEQKAADVTLSLPSTVMPANPRIFGREEYVNKAILLILSETSARIAILGPGGMGKTSVALKIVHDARIIKKFGKYRLWVACEQATSVPLLIELLAKVLKLPTSASGDRFSDVIAFLESLDVLVIFLFDNFETPWDIEGQRSDFGDVLARLASIPNVSIILTMRGNQCPYEESIDWSLPRLPFLTQLDLVAAEEAFLRISPNSSGDAELHTLLRELDCVPLAITLMAKLASGGESVHELLLQWKTERTRLLGQAGGDRRTSIEVSIKLSMDSQAVKANKDAITLIGIFAMLPGGAAVSRLPDMCPSIPNWNAALRVLLGAALVYHNPDRSLIQVLSPIRSYVLLHHPLEELPLGELQASYYRLAGKGASQPGDPDFLTNAKELGMEETNMEAILLDALQRQEKDKSSIISASLDYSNHLFWTQPRSNIMTVTTEVARTHHDPALADCLNTLGLILQYQTHYDAAKAAMEEAQAEYVSRGNRSGAANCLKSIGQILQMQTQYEAAEAALKEARAEYISLENRLGAANCLNTLGEILQLQSQYDAAEAMLKEARAEYISLGDRLGSANCLNALGEILQGQSQYDAAEVMLKEARAEYVSLGNRLGATNCLKSLGQILQMQAQYDAAESTLKEARAEYISFGDRLGAADCLKSLGGVLLAQTQYHAAHAALMEAKAEFVSLRNRLGVANCLYILGRESRIQGRFADALSQLEEARELYCAIGQVKWAEICSEQSSLASTMDSSA